MIRIIKISLSPQSPTAFTAEDTIATINYQLVFIFVLAVVLPIIYVGSSTELRLDSGVPG